jgi:integrase
MRFYPGTADGYRDIVRAHIIPELGAIRLPELKPEHLQTYYAHLLKSGRIQGEGGLSAQTVKNHHRVLSKALNHAVKQGRLMRNVALAVELPRCEYKRMSYLSPEDVNHFLNFAKDTPFYVLFYTAIYTGLRRGELLALRWKDIDLDFATLSVVQTLQHIPKAGYVIKEPKTRQSRRLVDLPTSLAIMLREYKQEQVLTFKNLWGNTITPDNLVFCTIEGKPLPPNGVTKAFRDLARKAGYRGVRFHDLRHTHATLMLRQGIHPKIVSERLGHTSIMITLDTYSHVLPGLQAAAAQRFDEGLGTDASSLTHHQALFP